MRSKITTRDVKSYMLGVLSFFLISAIVDWDDTVAAVKEGYEKGKNFRYTENNDSHNTETTAASHAETLK